MKCKICGAETNDGSNLCENCRERVEDLSLEMLKDKKKINLRFKRHHLIRR